MQTIDYLLMAVRWLFLLGLGYYVIVNLQWYHYKITRVLFKHHKLRWHLFYFVIPVLYFIFIPYNPYFYIGLLFYLLMLGIWIYRLSKKLVFTGRVNRFFIIYLCFIFLDSSLLLAVYEHSDIIQIVYLTPLVISVILSALIEKVLLNRYRKVAEDILDSMPNLTIIAVTGSYGKTSLKNFLAQVLQDKFKVYATPRSVNTLTGIIADINQNLSSLTDIYIVEAGARQVGDIKEIVEFINPQIAVVGKIGEAHIEYFKNIETIYQAKYEIFESQRLMRAYVYEDNLTPTNCQAPITYFPQYPSNVVATLEGTDFSLNIKGNRLNFHTQILGAFNVINIGAAIAVAKDLGIDDESIIKRVSKLQPINHRLSKMIVNNKIILDDSYNGNIDGMLEAIRLSSLYEGRKVIITPGLVESRDELNEQLAKSIDKVFNIAIITGELNSNILKNHIFKAQKIILKDRSNIENILKSVSQEGDLLLFANDAPSYI